MNEARWKLRFTSYQKALNQLKNALSLIHFSDLEKKAWYNDMNILLSLHGKQ